MTAFVFGATGFVGREVVRQLCVRGAQAIAHIRPDSSELETWRTRFTEMGATVDTTSWDPVQLAARFTVHRPAQVYICIGTTRKKAKGEHVQGDIYEQVDYGLTKIAVDAARASETSPRIVYLSSVDASLTSRSPYLRARAKAENAVTESGLPWVIARPSFITGQRDEARMGEIFGSAVTDGVLAVARLFGNKRLRAKYASTTPDVLASALIRIGELPEQNVLFDGDDLR